MTLHPRSATTPVGQMKTKMLFFGLFISVFYVVGFGLLGYSLISARRSIAAASWPRARGVITHCELVSSTDGEGGTTEKVNVAYTYLIGTKSYSGSRLAFGYSGSSAKSGNAEMVSKLKSAKSIEVRYDPADPTNSTLSYGIHRSIQFTLAFAITWLLFVIGFTLLFWVSSRADTVLLRNLIIH